MNRIVVALIGLIAATTAAAAPATTDKNIDRTLALVKAWVHGEYNSKAQFDSDVARKVPDNEVHRTMHQLFAPVTVPIPALDGYLVFQQSAADGSTNPAMIIRVGILQFLPDPVSGTVIQRELNFKNKDPYKNAHLNQDVLRKVTLADFNVNTGCDFFLKANKDGSEIAGPMKDGACRMKNPGTGQDMIADDAVVIRPQEFWFRGKFRDSAGHVVWGTESPEMNKLVRVSPL
jgi:hypothetical protein